MKNVLLIAVDDLRPEINCFGKKKLHTPNMDRLAGGGTIFLKSYCQAPQCMPSRASLMSGIRPDSNVYSRISKICKGGEPTLPGYFKKSGYTTVSIGKVYHFSDEDEDSWTRKYRDTFYEKDWVGDGYCSGYQVEENIRRVKNKVIFNNVVRDNKGIKGKMMKEYADKLPPLTECADVPDDKYPDGIISKLALEEMKELYQHGKPFFLAVGFYRPHLPWAAPKKYWDLYERDEIDLADNPFLPENNRGKYTLIDFLHYGDKEVAETYSDIGIYEDDDFPVLSQEKQRECIHGYWASVSFVDAQIGRLLDGLKEYGLEDDTLVVLYGDNGWHLGEHKLWAKCTSFEESTRVPLIISVKGMTKGEQSSSLVELLDIYPTLCDLCGLEKPSHLAGESLIPVLENPAYSVKDAVFSRLKGFSSVRTKEFRLTCFDYIQAEKIVDETDKYELYDLKVDSAENRNVAGKEEYGKIFEELKFKLQSC